jgi:hypothetical protein
MISDFRKGSFEYEYEYRPCGTEYDYEYEGVIAIMKNVIMKGPK